MNQNEAKKEQAKNTTRDVGRDQLKNWGLMIMSQGWPGPQGFKASPMFRDITSRYADEQASVRESFNTDEAYFTMDAMNATLNEVQILVCGCYFSVQSSRENISSALILFNALREKQGISEIKETAFKAAIRESESCIGTAYLLGTCDNSWQIISNELRALA